MLVLMLACGMLGIFALAETETIDVYITVADENGNVALAMEKISVSDTDGDGAITVNDALYAAHEAKFEGGAEAGYKSYEGAYGLAIEMLWGVNNGGAYGYYVNNASAMSLADTVKSGDLINAFIYTDLTAWSDTYCFFDVNTASAEAGTEFTLVLSAAGYDESLNPITVPVENAVITVNGTATEFKTDSDGCAAITVDTAGTYIISATSDSAALVPPVCVVTVVESEADSSESSEETTPQTGDSTNMLVFAGLILLALAGIKAVSAKSKR